MRIYLSNRKHWSHYKRKLSEGTSTCSKLGQTFPPPPFLILSSTKTPGHLWVFCFVLFLKYRLKKVKKADWPRTSGPETTRWWSHCVYFLLHISQTWKHQRAQIEKKFPQQKPEFSSQRISKGAPYPDTKHFSSVQFSHSVVSNSLRAHELPHTTLPCPSPTSGVDSNSCPSSWWCHPTISSSVVPSPFQHQGLFQWVSYLHQVAKAWSFSFSISPSNEYSGLISFRMDWLDLLAVQGTLKSLLQQHS